MAGNHGNRLSAFFIFEKQQPLARERVEHCRRCCCRPLVVIFFRFSGSVAWKMKTCRNPNCRLCLLRDEQGPRALGLENLWTSVSNSSIFKLQRCVSSQPQHWITAAPRMTFEEMQAYPSTTPWPYFPWQIMPTIEMPRASLVWLDLERFQHGYLQSSIWDCYSLASGVLESIWRFKRR